MADRPNVLFIITDQQRADHVGFAGNDIVRTPHIDSIAARGMVFDNAWVANPVCMPNRSSIMTGRMPTAHGVIFNDRSLDWRANTFVRSFRSAGYRTGLLGKAHLQHGMSRGDAHTIERPVSSDPHPAGWDTVEDFERYVAGDLPDLDDFYGFDTVELTLDHGGRVTGHHLWWAIERGASMDELVVEYDATSPARRRSDRWWQIYEPPYDPEIHSTSFVTDRAVSFIDGAVAENKPWLAWVSFPDPHHPFTPPGEYFDRHRPADMPVPSTIDDPIETGFPHLRMLQQLAPQDQMRWVAPCGSRDRALVQECTAATFGMIEMIDDGVGRILETVERHGQTDDTIVVFTSDHGDMMGDHGLLLKAFNPFRQVLQPPMVIADPRKEAGRTSSLIASHDLAPTLLDLADLDDYYGIQGCSQTAVLDDPTESARDHVLVEDDFPDHVAARFRLPPKIRTVVRPDGVKYSRDAAGHEMLYDLAADPTEMTELAQVDNSRRTEMVELLAHAMIQNADAARGAPVG